MTKRADSGPVDDARASATRAKVGPERLEGVVGDFSSPYQVPERVEDLLVERAAGRLLELGKEGGPPRSQVLAQLMQ